MQNPIVVVVVTSYLSMSINSALLAISERVNKFSQKLWCYVDFKFSNAETSSPFSFQFHRKRITIGSAIVILWLRIVKQNEYELNGLKLSFALNEGYHEYRKNNKLLIIFQIDAANLCPISFIPMA